MLDQRKQLSTSVVYCGSIRLIVDPWNWQIVPAISGHRSRQRRCPWGSLFSQTMPATWNKYRSTSIPSANTISRECVAISSP